MKTTDTKTKKKEIIETIPAEYRFTDKDTIDLAQKLGRKNAEARDLENQKKTVAADFTARLTSCESEIAVLSMKINNGYEMRETECRVEFDVPGATKHYYNRKTGAFVRADAMTAADYQRDLPIEPEPEVVDAEVVEFHPQLGNGSEA